MTIRSTIGSRTIRFASSILLSKRLTLASQALQVSISLRPTSEYLVPRTGGSGNYRRLPCDYSPAGLRHDGPAHHKPGRCRELSSELKLYPFEKHRNVVSVPPRYGSSPSPAVAVKASSPLPPRMTSAPLFTHQRHRTILSVAAIRASPLPSSPTPPTTPQKSTAGRRVAGA
jgi:hypothetical protein